MLQFDPQEFFENAYTVVEIDGGFGILNVYEDTINQAERKNANTVYILKLQKIGPDTPKTSELDVYTEAEAWVIMDDYVASKIATYNATMTQSEYNAMLGHKLSAWAADTKRGRELSAWAAQKRAK